MRYTNASSQFVVEFKIKGLSVDPVLLDNPLITEAVEKGPLLV